MLLLYYLPSQEDLDHNKSIYILVVPLVLYEVFNSYFSKEEYIERGFEEKNLDYP